MQTLQCTSVDRADVFSDVNQIIFKYASSHMAPRVNFVDKTTLSETVMSFHLFILQNFIFKKKIQDFVFT